MVKKSTDIKPKQKSNQNQNEATNQRVQKNQKTEKVEKSQKNSKNDTTFKNKKQQKDSKKQQKKEKLNFEQEEEKYDPNVLEDHEEKEALESIEQKFKSSLAISQKNLNLNSALVSKAINCIKEIISKRYENTLNILSNEDEELIYLNFVLGRLPLKYSLRPVAVPLEKSLHNIDMNTRICLFVKDPKSEFKDINIDFPIKVKVIDVQGLKLKYSRFQDRRNLLKQYDLFLCDYKIYFVLKRLLGKPFYVSKKYPVPIKLNYEKPEEIKSEILNHVQNSGFFYMTNGPNYTFKVARFSMNRDNILKNVLKSVNHVIAHIMKWGVSFEE